MTNNASYKGRRSLKGPRLYDGAWLPYGSKTASGWHKGLLIRRKIGKPDRLTFYLTLSPETTTLPESVGIAGTRWTIKAWDQTPRRLPNICNRRMDLSEPGHVLVDRPAAKLRFGGVGACDGAITITGRGTQRPVMPRSLGLRSLG